MAFRRSRNGRTRRYRRSRARLIAAGAKTLRRRAQYKRAFRRGWNSRIPGQNTTQQFFERFGPALQTPTGGTGVLDSFLTFSLDQFSTAVTTPFTLAYKYYRIKKIYVEAVPNVQRPVAQTTPGQYMPELWTVIDRDFALTLSDSEQLFSSTPARRHKPLSNIKRSWIPNTLGVYTDNASLTFPSLGAGATIQYNEWFSTFNTSALYYGLRFYSNVNTAFPVNYITKVRVLVEFKEKSQA